MQWNIRIGKASEISFSHFSGKRKDDTISNIEKRMNTVHSKTSYIETVERTVHSGGKPDPAPLHDFYRAWFNLIDSGNRYWYEVADAHHNQSWKSKMSFGLFRAQFLSFWAIIASKNFQDWRDFRRSFALSLIADNQNIRQKA